MSIIFGKRSDLPSVCSACGIKHAMYGVTSLKYAKQYDIMWTCGDCCEDEHWNRIYSMNQKQIGEKEERCIGIASANISREFVTAILEAMHGSDCVENISEMTGEDFEELCFSIRQRGALIEPSKKLLLEYSKQLKIW